MPHPGHVCDLPTVRSHHREWTCPVCGLRYQVKFRQWFRMASTTEPAASGVVADWEADT